MATIPNTRDTLATPAPLDMRCSIAVFRDDEVLLVRSVEDGAEVWKLPGGHLHPDEGMFHCALRELEEETGLTAEVCSCAFVLDTRDPATDRRLAEVVMLARHGTPGTPRQREARLEPRFVPIADVPGLPLRPAVAPELAALLGHDVVVPEPYESLRERHEEMPYYLV